jgi:hypothetical protein
MLLTEYLSALVKIIDNYSKTNLIISSEIKNDFRTEQIGIIRGNLVFADQSILYFTEYLDLRYRVEKLSFSYHYQKKTGTLIFRYDNARHRPKLAFENHKHVADGKITEAGIPALTDVFDEVMDYLL